MKCMVNAPRDLSRLSQNRASFLDVGIAVQGAQLLSQNNAFFSSNLSHPTQIVPLPIKPELKKDMGVTDKKLKILRQFQMSSYTFVKFVSNIVCCGPGPAGPANLHRLNRQGTMLCL